MTLEVVTFALGAAVNAAVLWRVLRKVEVPAPNVSAVPVPAVMDPAHRVCDFCKLVVARFEDHRGLIKCANCKAEGK